MKRLILLAVFAAVSLVVFVYRQHLKILITSIEPLFVSATTLPSYDYSFAGYRNGQPIPYRQRTATHEFGVGRFTQDNQIKLTSGQVLRGQGPDQTVLYFPRGLRDMFGPCVGYSSVDCYQWSDGLIEATGSEIGIEDVTIEFPAHAWGHYSTANRGFNGPDFKACTNCWMKNVVVKYADVGVSFNSADRVTVEDTEVHANPAIGGGGHIHYNFTGSTRSLVNRFKAFGDSAHGLTGNWGGEGNVFADGILQGSIPLEPQHNGPQVLRTLYSYIRGDISRIQGGYTPENIPLPGVYPYPDALLWNVVIGSNTVDPIELYSVQLAARHPNATPSPTATPTPTPAPNFYCKPFTATGGLNQNITFNVFGGAAPYKWSAPGRNPSSGTQTQFLTKYSTIGTKTVQVISNNLSAKCSVLITSTATTVTPTPTMAGNVDYVSEGPATAPGNLIAGQPASFSGIIRNLGTASASSSSQTRTRLDIGNNGTFDVTFANQTTGTLAAGASEVETWGNVWIAQSGTHRFEICADVNNAIIESNEANNCVQGFFTVGSSATPTPSPLPNPTPIGSALACTSSVSSSPINKYITFSASGGSGTYSWSASGGSPSSGTQSTLVTRYSTTGIKTIYVFSDNLSASCKVLIQ